MLSFLAPSVAHPMHQAGIQTFAFSCSSQVKAVLYSTVCYAVYYSLYITVLQHSIVVDT